MEKNKIIEYKGYKFNIKVIVDDPEVLRPRSERRHTVQINDMGASNWIFSDVASTLTELEESINKCEIEAKRWVDNRGKPKTPEESFLAEEGFK